MIGSMRQTSRSRRHQLLQSSRNKLFKGRQFEFFHRYIRDSLINNSYALYWNTCHIHALNGTVNLWVVQLKAIWLDCRYRQILWHHHIFMIVVLWFQFLFSKSSWIVVHSVHINSPQSIFRVLIHTYETWNWKIFHWSQGKVKLLTRKASRSAYVWTEFLLAVIIVGCHVRWLKWLSLVTN